MLCLFSAAVFEPFVQHREDVEKRLSPGEKETTNIAPYLLCWVFFIFIEIHNKNKLHTPSKLPILLLT